MTISPPPLDDYRILREGEVIEEGDEVSLQGSELPWAKALHIGQRAPCSSFPFARIYRRRSKVNEYNREVNDKRGMDGASIERAELAWANLPTGRKWTGLATHEKALVCHTLARVTTDIIEALAAKNRNLNLRLMTLTDDADEVERALTAKITGLEGEVERKDAALREVRGWVMAGGLAIVDAALSPKDGMADPPP